MPRPTVLAALTFIVLSTGLTARVAAAEAAAPSELERALREQLERNKYLSFVAAEVDATGEHYYAIGDLGTGTPVKPEKVVFEIGSITKVFTGLLLAQAVLEQRVQLDDPIARHLPTTLKLPPGTAAITLQQLATHSSGLPRNPDNWRSTDEADMFAHYDVASLHRFLEAFSCAGPTREAHYSNLGAAVLGHVLARVYGKPYPELVAEKITRPLGLTDTVRVLDDEQQRRLAAPRDGRAAGKSWVTSDALLGCGGYRSTATDLVRLAQALMSGKSPLERAWQLARERRVASPDTGASDAWGLGIGVSRSPEGESYGHPGTTGAYRALWSFTPATNHVLVILTNNAQADVMRIGYDVAHAAERKAREARPEAPITAAELARYVGVFRPIDRKAANQQVRVLVAPADRLCWQMTGSQFRPVYHGGHDEFFSRRADVQLRFERDSAGTVTGLMLTQDGDGLKMSRLPGDTRPNVRFRSAAELAPYLGVYHLNDLENFEITQRAITAGVAQLYARITNQQSCPVFTDDAPDHFVYDVVEASITFERDAKGAAQALVLHQNGKDFRAPRVAE